MESPKELNGSGGHLKNFLSRLSTGEAHSFPRLSGWFWCVLAAATCIGGIVAVAMGYHALPLHDSWYFVDLHRAWGEGGITLPELWALHNEHRILTLRLILLADLWLESARGYYVIALIFLIQGLHAGLMARVLARETRITDPTRVFLICVGLILFFWLRQRENFGWSFQVAWFLHTLMVSGAAWLVAGIGDIGERKGRSVRLLLAASACFIAATTVASGVFLSLLLFVVLWKMSRPRSVQLIWMSFAGLLLATYLSGYSSPSYHSSPEEAFGADTFLFILAYIGNPVALNGVPVAMVIASGLCVLAIYAWLVIRYLKSSASPRLDHFAFVVSTQMVLMAGLTSVGRHTMGIGQAAASRYATPALVLWFIVAAWGISVLADRPHARTWCMRVLGAFVLLFVVPTQALLFPRVMKMHVSYDESALALMAGVEDTAATKRTLLDTEGLWKLDAEARNHGLAHYGPAWTRWPRDGFGSGSADTLADVRAVLMERKAVGTPERPGFYVSGRLVTEADIRVEAFTDFLFTRGDSIVGYARSRGRPCGGCFTGYVRGGAEFDLNAVVEASNGELRTVFVP